MIIGLTKGIIAFWIFVFALPFIVIGFLGAIIISALDVGAHASDLVGDWIDDL